MTNVERAPRPIRDRVRAQAKAQPDRFVVRKMDVPDVGHEWDSKYVEHFWLPVLGPTAMWAYRALVISPRYSQGDTRTWGIQHLADHMGVGVDKAHAAVARLCIFNLVRWASDTELEVRVYVPTLHTWQMRRFPQWLRDAHARWEAADRAVA